MGTLSSVRTTISTHYLQSIVASGHWHSLTCRHTAETNLLSSILHKSCEWKLKSAETCQLSSPGAKLALRWQQMCQLFYTENICHFQLVCRKKLLKYNLSILVFAQCTHHYRSNFTPVLVLGCIHTGLVWRWHGVILWLISYPEVTHFIHFSAWLIFSCQASNVKGLRFFGYVKCK